VPEGRRNPHYRQNRQARAQPEIPGRADGVGIDFACLDNQPVQQVTVHILVGVAEEESAKISERTKRTLRAAVKIRNQAGLGPAWSLGRTRALAGDEAGDRPVGEDCGRQRTRQTYEYCSRRSKK